MENGAENGKAEKPVDSSIFRLSKPLKLTDGRELKELRVDVDTLVMRDLHNLEMEYNAIFPGVSPTNGIYLTDSKYQALMVAKANGIIYDQLANLNAKDALSLGNRLGKQLVEESPPIE